MLSIQLATHAIVSNVRSEEVRRGTEAEKKQNTYAEDAEITAQIHLTLADLDADLAGDTNELLSYFFAADRINLSFIFSLNKNV